MNTQYIIQFILLSALHVHCEKQIDIKQNKMELEFTKSERGKKLG